MAMWALLDDNVEITAYRGIDGDDCRKGCEEEAIRLDLAAMTKKGIALGPGVEIVCLED